MFLIARYVQVLKDVKSKDRTPDAYMNNELVVIAKKVKSKDLTEASIILDIANKKVIKNRFNENSFDELWQYYLTHYSQYINQWVVAQGKVRPF